MHNCKVTDLKRESCKEKKESACLPWSLHQYLEWDTASHQQGNCFHTVLTASQSRGFAIGTMPGGGRVFSTLGLKL